MGAQVMLVKGLDGHIELLTDRVVIHRTGFANAVKYGANAHREIPLSAIAEVVFKNAGLFSMGQVEFVRAGRSADERKKDYTAIKFNKRMEPQFVVIKEKIFELMSQK